MYVKGDHVCSATLIDKSVAITAAHCLEPNGFPATVKDIELVLFSNESKYLREKRVRKIFVMKIFFFSIKAFFEYNFRLSFYRITKKKCGIMLKVSDVSVCYMTT